MTYILHCPNFTSLRTLGLQEHSVCLQILESDDKFSQNFV
jgi:hypothetical protein